MYSADPMVTIDRVRQFTKHFLSAFDDYRYLFIDSVLQDVYEEVVHGRDLVNLAGDIQPLPTET